MCRKISAQIPYKYFNFKNINCNIFLKCYQRKMPVAWQAPRTSPFESIAWRVRTVRQWSVELFAKHLPILPRATRSRGQREPSWEDGRQRNEKSPLLAGIFGDVRTADMHLHQGSEKPARPCGSISWTGTRGCSRLGQKLSRFRADIRGQHTTY